MIDTIAHQTNDEQAHSFGLWLRQQRQRLGLTQRDLARVSGCALSTIRKLEADERRPSSQVVAALARHVSVAADGLQVVPHHARIQPQSVLHETAYPTSNGRERDGVVLRNRLGRAETRLITLHGASGVGKTFVARMIAPCSAVDRGIAFRWVSLAAVASTADALRCIGDVETLGTQPLLLVLDCVEGDWGAPALLRSLLATSPQVQLLVTRSTPFGIHGEHAMRIDALAFPDAQMPIPTAARTAAVALFRDLAQRAAPNVALDPQQLAAICALCRFAQGLPLAITLIAARTRHLSPVAILDQFHSADIDYDHPHEPQAVIATVLRWSYQLLSVNEQRVVQRLAFLGDDWQLRQAELFCAFDDLLPIDVLDAVETLCDVGLVQLVADDSSEPRFALCAAVGAFAWQQLCRSGTLPALQAHADNLGPPFESLAARC